MQTKSCDKSQHSKTLRDPKDSLRLCAFSCSSALKFYQSAWVDRVFLLNREPDFVISHPLFHLYIADATHAGQYS